MSLTPVADAQVSSDTPTTNYGTSTTWLVNRQTGMSYLRFDLSGIPTNVHVTAVTLSAQAYDGYAYGGDGNVYTTFVPDDTWSETGITWNNKPATSGNTLGEWFLWYDYTPVDKLGVNSSPLLIPVVQQELAGDKRVSFRLNSTGYKTRYRSREYADATQRPKLVITYDLPEVTTVLEPEADTYANGDFWGERDWNYGSSTELLIHPYFDRRVFLRFNLGSIPASATIKSATLSSTAFYGMAGGGDGNVYTYLVPDNTWGELTLTYNNQPAVQGEPLGSWFLWYPQESPYFDQVGSMSDPALIPAIQNASRGADRRISFRLTNTGSPGYQTSYYSRESPDAAKHPKLTVTYAP
ncbi:hypothetical protein DRW03_03355 [Corallococcus sp. H22C18031201]|nr:hypothetical protein DRW03_03355 [Corallococcus sp. H22C18031201]